MLSSLLGEGRVIHGPQLSSVKSILGQHNNVNDQPNNKYLFAICLQASRPVSVRVAGLDKSGGGPAGDRVRPAGGEGGDMEPAGEGDYIPWPTGYPDEVRPNLCTMH